MLMSRAKYSVHSRDPKIQAKVAHVEDFWDKFHTARGKGNTEDPCVRAWNYIVLHIKDSGGSRNKVYIMVEHVLGCVEAKGRPEKIMKRAIKSYLAD